MRFFKKAKKNSGWLALAFQRDAILSVHVQRVTGAKPAVQLAKSFPADKPASPEALLKLSKEIGAENYAITTLLASSEYQFLSVDAPNVPPDELKVAMRWRLKDLIDFHIEDATIDVLDVPLDKDAPVRNKSMYAVAARNTVIQARQALFTEAKLPLSVIDIPEMAQRNIAQLFEPEGRGLAFLTFDAEGGLLTVNFKGELFLSRRIDISLGALQQAAGDQRAAQFDRITLELQRSLDHFDRQYNFIPMAKLVLGPIGAVGTALKDYLASNLYVPVEACDLKEILDLGAVPELADSNNQAQFFTSIGAALRLEEKVL